MERSAFLMSNIPHDQELLIDFVEGTIEGCVNVFNFSATTYNTALVIMDRKLDMDIKDIAESLKKEEDLLDEKSGPLGVIDPGLCDDSLIVENVDERLLSLELLQLYIQSTFADGSEVVSKTCFIPNHEKTARITFHDDKKEVIHLVLENEIHRPFSRAKPDYEIKMKPYYSKFYSIEDKEDATGQISDNETDDEDKITSYENEDKEDEVEKKTNPYKLIKIPLKKIFWKWWKEEIRRMAKCRVDYITDEESLDITGVESDVIEFKKKIQDLLHGIDKCTAPLTGEQTQYLQDEKVKKILKYFCKTQLDNTLYEVTDTHLSVYSKNPEANLEQLMENFLFKEIVTPPAGVPDEILRESVHYCKYHYMVMVTLDEVFTLTGKTEDVIFASRDIKSRLENYGWVNVKFSLKEREVNFVNSFCSLEKIIKETEGQVKITKTIQANGEQILVYAVRKQFQEKFELILNNIKGNIKTVEVNLKEFDEVEIVLISKYIKIDPVFFKDFKKTHKCCLFVDGNDGEASICARSRLPENKPDVYSKPVSGKKSSQSSGIQAFAMDTSCTLQVLPIGNLLTENTELLVAGVHDNLKLFKTSTGNALSKRDASLQEDIKTFTFSSNGVTVVQRQLQGTNCQAIAFITFSIWDENVSEQKLNSAVSEVLEKANDIGVTSVSFPPLGPGRAFKFPEDRTAHAMANAIDTFQKAHSKGHSLKLINLISPGNFFVEVSKAVAAIFQPKDDDDSDSNHSSDESSEDDDDVPQATGGQTNETQGSEMEVSRTGNPLRIEIVSEKDIDCASILKDEIKKKWLHEDEIDPSEEFSLSPKFVEFMMEAAEKSGVWAGIIKHPDKGHSVLKFKGNLEAVNKVRKEISSEVMNINRQISMKPLYSKHAPKRGTMDFVSYAAKTDVAFPPYWKLKQSEDIPSFQIKKYEELDVDPQIYKLIEKLVLDTWNVSRVGYGRDAVNIVHGSSVKVTAIKRIENPSLFAKYVSKRRTVFNQVISNKKFFPDVAQLTGSKGPVETMVCLPESEFKSSLLYEVNEFFLFHGTKPKTVTQICEQGIDALLSSSKAMFGKGVYTAESSTKADQYTDDRNNRLPNGSDLTMFLTRVTMGDVFLCDNNHPSVANKDSEKLSRPPCKTCFQDRCQCTGNSFYDSVMGDGNWNFREFIVYHTDDCYPEFMITYQRV